MLLRLVVLLLLFVPFGAAHGDPGDIDAAARGVVRVVIIASEDGTGEDGASGEREVFPVSHGSGFAVTSNTIVTNAHVVRDAVADPSLRIGIVPSDGAEADYGRIVAISPRNDLALVRIDGSLRLPPLALAGRRGADSGESYAVGYPMNVDRAQGLELSEVFESQPPVKSRGFLAGSRPSRQFDTLLHTAPIARGNSGGPLLDGCGRVLGVNSFGADSGGSDAEFFFAVSNAELRPFLRENGIAPRVNETPCRSLAALDAEERERRSREQEAARADLASRAEADRVRQDRARFEAQMAVHSESEDRLFLAVVLLLVAAGAGVWGFVTWPERVEGSLDETSAHGGSEDDEGLDRHGSPSRKLHAAVILAAVGLAGGAVVVFATRPGIDEVDRRVAAAPGQGSASSMPGAAPAPAALAADAGEASYRCTLDAQRSRVTNSQVSDLAFTWNARGCVNRRTQYGYNAGIWSRVLVPNDEQAVSINSFDPDRRTFRSERYLLSRGAMRAAREARGRYRAPSCEAEGAATRLGDLQRSITAGLPERANERLIYDCELDEAG